MLYCPTVRKYVHFQFKPLIKEHIHANGDKREASYNDMLLSGF